MSKIGYQDGIKGFIDWLRKQSGVPPRGPRYNANDISTWPWPDKLERTLRTLKDAHDASVTDPEPPPPPPPPPPNLWFPRTYNKVLPNGQDARYCVNRSDPAYSHDANGLIWDKGGASYDTNGLCVNGLRSPDTQVPGLKPANEMDSRGACDPYGPFPPWPEGSYVR